MIPNSIRSSATRCKKVSQLRWKGILAVANQGKDGKVSWQSGDQEIPSITAWEEEYSNSWESRNSTGHSKHLQPCSRKRLNYQGQFSCSLPAAAQPSGPEDTQSQAVAKNIYHMEQLVVQIQVKIKADKEAQATVDPEDQEEQSNNS